MKKQILRLQSHQPQKTIGFDENVLLISTKKHADFDSLLASTEKKGLLESLKNIPLSSIISLKCNLKEPPITIKYTNEKGKEKKETILLNKQALNDPFITALGETKGLTRKEEEESKVKPLLINLVLIGCAIPLVIYLRSIAIDAENGIVHVATGRKSGGINLVTDIIVAIGATGVTCIGILGVLYLLFNTYKRYNNPSKNIFYD